MTRLRLDAELIVDLTAAIDQAHAEATAYLDGTLYATEGDRVAANDPRGIVCTPDLIAAQLLLVDVLVGSNSVNDREAKTSAARRMLRPHRNMGA